MACGGHVYWQIGTKWAIFIDDLPMMLPTKFRFIWQSGFREDFLEINQSETRIAFGGHVCQWIGTKLAIFIKDFPRMLPTKFRFIWPSGFRGDNFLEINQSETRIVCGGHVCKLIGTKWALFIVDLSWMLPTKFWFIWPSRTLQRRRFFRNQPIRNKNCLWLPCLIMDRDEMSNLYRGPSIDASYQVSVHLVKWFQRRRLKCEN